MRRTNMMIAKTQASHARTVEKLVQKAKAYALRGRVVSDALLAQVPAHDPHACVVVFQVCSIACPHSYMCGGRSEDVNAFAYDEVYGDLHDNRQKQQATQEVDRTERKVKLHPSLRHARPGRLCERAYVPGRFVQVRVCMTHHCMEWHGVCVLGV